MGAMLQDDPTLPPRAIIDHYCRAYQLVNRREAKVRYMGNHWYNVNGETVHRSTLIEEIGRLRDLAQKQHLMHADKGVIQKLIARLRGL